MTMFLQNLWHLLVKTLPWWGLSIVAFGLCYLFVPMCRKLATRFGMVDQPSARRINKTPIPRAGGFAIYLAVSIVFVGYSLLTGNQITPGLSNAMSYKIFALVSALVIVGLLDDKFGLPPLVKLAGQVGVALGTFFWCGIGFHDIPFLDGMPTWLDCIVTVVWIVGAVNAFNLIDGLDGLATGLAIIATLGMAGALFFIGHTQNTLIYFVFGGACLAFLRYNFNPASVFLGDTGSMYIGYVISVMPLVTKSSDSLFVSIGVPLLAMGVPIFDTSLAILRRTVRAVLRHEEKGTDPGNSHVMQADTDHLHHRILRRFVSQRKAAGALYCLAGFFVLIGLGGIALRDRAAGFFAIAFIVAIVIIVRDMRRIELYDAGRLLDTLAHSGGHGGLRRKRLITPYYVAMDVFLLSLACVVGAIMMGQRTSAYLLHTALPLRVVPVFFCLIFFKAYTTVWSRAQLSNFIRLVVACFLGTVIGSAGIIIFKFPHKNLILFTILYFTLTAMLLSALRLMRPFLRDTFYALNHGRIADNPSTSRVIVYGAGLRYKMFRKELVRMSTRSNRVIVGLLDDDAFLRGLHIGGRKVFGTLEDAKDVIKKLRADAIVIACKLSPERLAEAKKIFAEAGVKTTIWSCEEKEFK